MFQKHLHDSQLCDNRTVHSQAHTQHTYHTSVKDNRKKILGEGEASKLYEGFLLIFKNKILPIKKTPRSLISLMFHKHTTSF